MLIGAAEPILVAFAQRLVASLAFSGWGNCSLAPPSAWPEARAVVLFTERARRSHPYGLPSLAALRSPGQPSSNGRQPRIIAVG